MSDLNGNYETTETTVTESAPRWMTIAIVALAAISVTGIGMAWNASNRAQGAEQTLAAQTKTVQTNVDSVQKELTQAEQTNSQMQGELNLVGDKLKLTEGELTTARTQVKQTRADYTKKLDEVNSVLATKASSDDVKAIGGDVNGVKTDLNSTKSNLDLLRSEHGELIARNHEELDQLRRMGERDYFEFSLASKGQKERVGSMQVELRGVNVKNHQFSLALYVDDLRLEKKNRAMNEPIYFYTSGSRTPMELVVNEVSKNKVTGYVSVPKNVATTAKVSGD
jgi:chromosome segregation ATPase